MRAPIIALLAAVAALSLPRVAWAHPDVDEARRLIEAADFDGALGALERAERGEALTRPDIIALLEARVLVSYALARPAATEDALARLAALEPQHAFPAGTNPDIVARFRAVRDRREGPLGLEVQALPATDALELQARVLRAPPGLVAGVRLHVRRHDEPWRAHEGATLRVPLAPAAGAEAVTFRGDVVGAGGATLLTTPLETWRGPAVAGDEPAPASPSRARWYWTAAALAVATGTVSAILLLRPDERTHPDRPAVVGWR